MADTVRTLDELLTVLFASGQPPRSITEQDIRDAIVSLSLETADFSGLPRSVVGLNIGRFWIDGNKALRVTTVFTAQDWAVQAGLMAGAASLTADGRVSGQANVYNVTARLSGAGGTTMTAGPLIRSGRSNIAAAASLGANARTRFRASAGIAGAGGITATASGARSGTTRVDAASSITATAQVLSGQVWGTAAPSLTKSNNNLTLTRTGGVDGTSSTALSTQHPTTGKYYWEVALSGGTQTAVVGFSNPSLAAADNTQLGPGNNSIAYYTHLGVGGLVINSNWVQDLPLFTTSSVISFALDVTNSRWWARVNGGTWIGAGNTAGTPDAGINPITAICSTVGGLGPCAEFNVLNQTQTLRIPQPSWQYQEPAGFGAFGSSQSSSGTGQFVVSNGKILDPDGKIWRGLGVGVYAAAAASGGAAYAQTIRSKFPGMNLIRISFQASAMTDPTTHAAFVKDMTDQKVVCIFEDHNENQTVLTSSTTPTLSAESAWYVSVVNTYAANPYVLVQTMNEPNINDGPQMQATYNAIRGAGSNKLLFFEAGYVAQGLVMTGLTGNPMFATMTNVAWDLHPYVDPPSNLSVATITANNAATVAKLNAIHSADGVMPVLVIEIGNQEVYATNNDPSGVAQVTAAFANPQGACAWIYHAGGGPTGIQDNLTNPDGTLTSYGVQVAGLIAAG